MSRSQLTTWRQSRRRVAYSTVGTPDYIAPEIFNGQGYSFSCDWWSVGAIMFECLIGWPPFCAEDAHDTYRKIVNWKQTLYFPDDNPLAESENNRSTSWPIAEDCIRGYVIPWLIFLILQTDNPPQHALRRPRPSRLPRWSRRQY